MYDTLREVWGTVTAAAPRSPALMVPACGLYPVNNARPQISVHGNLIASVGGEATERTINGHTFSHDSDFAVLGRINRGLKSDDGQALSTWWVDPITIKVTHDRRLPYPSSTKGVNLAAQRGECERAQVWG